MSPAITSACVNVYPSHHNQALKSTSTNPFLNKNKGSSLSGVNPIVLFFPIPFAAIPPLHPSNIDGVNIYV